MGALDTAKPVEPWENDALPYANSSLRSAGATMAAANPELADSLRAAGRLPLNGVTPKTPASPPAAGLSQGASDLKTALDEVTKEVLPQKPQPTNQYAGLATTSDGRFNAAAYTNAPVFEGQAPAFQNREGFQYALPQAPEPPKDPATGLNSYAVGTPLVEEDQYAKLHAGEAVVPADQNPNNPAAGVDPRNPATFMDRSRFLLPDGSKPVLGDPGYDTFRQAAELRTRYEANNPSQVDQFHRALAKQVPEDTVETLATGVATAPLFAAGRALQALPDNRQKAFGFFPQASGVLHNVGGALAGLPDAVGGAVSGFNAEVPGAAARVIGAPLDATGAYLRGDKGAYDTAMRRISALAPAVTEPAAAEPSAPAPAAAEPSAPAPAAAKPTETAKTLTMDKAIEFYQRGLTATPEARPQEVYDKTLSALKRGLGQKDITKAEYYDLAKKAWQAKQDAGSDKILGALKERGFTEGQIKQEIRNRTLAGRRRDELTSLGGNVKGLNEEQITEALRGKMKELNDAGLSPFETRLAFEKELKQGAAKAGIDPEKISPAGRAAAFEKVKRSALEQKAKDKYSKYSWFGQPPRGEGKNAKEPTRRQKEWNAYETLRDDHPQIDATQVIRKDGTIDYAKAASLIRSEMAGQAVADRNRKTAGDTASIAQIRKRTEALQRSIDLEADPTRLTPKQKKEQQELALLSSGELSAFINRTGTYNFEKPEYTDIDSDTWKGYVTLGDAIAAKIAADPKEEQVFMDQAAAGEIPSKVVDYVLLKRNVERGRASKASK